MDTKQLLTGKPREGFYPVVQDTVTVIELNEAVMSLTSESSSEDIAASFDTVEGFNELIENVRNSENIVNGILMNNENAIGKIICTIYAYKNQYACDIEYIYDSKIIRLDITNTDGTLSCVRTESNIGGDKTNVLILSLENDLANGQKDSPVDAEVSTALKDAISTGKACVIKSVNSDILANLQQTGDNVTIVMEQISRIGQTFVAVNTTITVNTATNVISDYQTGAIVLETEGDGSKFLSNDGSYKEIDTNNIYLLDSNLLSGDTGNIGTDKFNEILNAINNDKIIIVGNKDEGINYITSTYANSEQIAISINIQNLFRTITINSDGSYSSTSSYLISNNDVLTKTNATEYTPTSDYQPTTKKYVDDKVNIPVIDAGISDITDDITGDYILNIPNNTTQVYLVNLNVLGYVPLVGYYVPIDDRFYYKYSGYLKREDGTGNKMNNGFYYVTIDGSNLHIELKQLILTESQYSALGDTSSDDVLYFITPD